MQHLTVRAQTHSFAKHYRAMYSLSIHPAPTHWYNQRKSYSHCVSTQHPPIVKLSNTESDTDCVSTQHPTTSTTIQSNTLTAYPPCTLPPLCQTTQSHILRRIHLAPTNWYNHTESYTHCTSTLHPHIVKPNHIESHTYCISTLHPPTAMPSHIESSTDCVSTLHPPTGTTIQSHTLTAYPPCNLPPLRQATQSHILTACPPYNCQQQILPTTITLPCAVALQFRPCAQGRATTFVLLSSGLSDSLATVRIASLLRPVTIRTIIFC